jgi:polyhydroxybutyrate depolymerase
MRPLLGACALLIVPLAACTGDEPRPELRDCEPGAFTIVDEVTLDEYTYSLSFPCPDDEGARYPAVIVLHGMPGDGWGARTASNMDVLAEEEGFIAVYPSNPDGRWSPAPEGADVDFIAALIDDLVGTWQVDDERVYVAGFSNGGDMAMAAASAHPDRVAGAAPVALSGTGDVLDAVTAGSEPVPVVAFIGENDTRYGDAGRAVVDAWLEARECNDHGVMEAVDDWELALWLCAETVPVQIYRVDGGHQWFGSPRQPDSLWASRTLWSFFSA